VTFSVNINNQVINPFNLHTCGRHGYPLAPYMYVTVAKTSDVAIKNVVRTSLVKGVSLSQYNSQQTIGQYVDKHPLP
jgi:hypothetical protein